MYINICNIYNKIFWGHDILVKISKNAGGEGVNVLGFARIVA